MNRLPGSSFGGGGVEIIDEAKEKAKAAKSAQGGSMIFTVSILTMVGVMGYFGYLVMDRIIMLGEITTLGEDMKTLGANINKDEINEFKSLDKTLKSINGKLSTHILNTQVLDFVNQNIRNVLQVAEYKIDTTDKGVEVGLTVIAPSFKELAEQTEKLYQLKLDKEIVSFTVSNLSFESETRRLRFGINIVFDKTKVAAVNPAAPVAPPVNNGATTSTATTTK